MTNLTDLDLAHNQLTGNIPPELGNLAKLTDLSMSNNGLSGSIPPQLGNLTKLTSLWLADTQLSGSLPIPLENLTRLQMFYFFNTSLCEPSDTAFQAWLKGIAELEGTNICHPTISGNAGVAGATLSYTDVIYKTAISGSDGSYSFTVSYNWSGTVTPSLTGYTFSPTSLSYTNVLANQINQNFTAAQVFTISGNAGVAGATLSYTDGTTKTAISGSDGSYSFTVSYNWSGTVTPSLTGYTFFAD